MGEAADSPTPAPQKKVRRQARLAYGEGALELEPRPRFPWGLPKLGRVRWMAWRVDGIKRRRHYWQRSGRRGGRKRVPMAWSCVAHVSRAGLARFSRGGHKIA